MKEGQRAAVWVVNGAAGGAVDAADRGLAYGDGLFETMAARDGRVPLLAFHLERLAEGCGRLRIPPPDSDVVTAEIAQYAAGRERAVVKLVVTRGSGGRGYGPPARPEPARILGIFPWPERDPAHYTGGIVLRTSTMTIGESDRLAGLKHLGRLEQVAASLELDPAADEGLQRRAGGYVVGGIGSNVFIVRGGSVSTPAIVTCGVRGVMRRVVIEACEREGLTIAETDMRAADLHAADEIFVTNAVAGVLPVRDFDGRAFEPGPVTRRLQHATAFGG